MSDSPMDMLTIISAIILVVGIIITLAAFVYWAVVGNTDEWFWILLIFGLVIALIGFVGVMYAIGRRRMFLSEQE